MDILEDTWRMNEHLPATERYKLIALLELAGFNVTDFVKHVWEMQGAEWVAIAHNITGTASSRTVRGASRIVGEENPRQSITYKELHSQLLKILIPTANE